MSEIADNYLDGVAFDAEGNFDLSTPERRACAMFHTLRFVIVAASAYHARGPEVVRDEMYSAAEKLLRQIRELDAEITPLTEADLKPPPYPAPSTPDELDAEAERYATPPGLPTGRRDAIAQAYRDAYRTALGDLISRGLIRESDVPNLSPAFRNRNL